MDPHARVFGPAPNGYCWYHLDLELGHDYPVRRWKTWVKCRLIRVTQKGFNLLYLDTSRCLLRHHLYAKGFAGKPIPSNQKTFRFAIPDYIEVLRN